LSWHVGPATPLDAVGHMKGKARDGKGGKQHRFVKVLPFIKHFLNRGLLHFLIFISLCPTENLLYFPTHHCAFFQLKSHCVTTCSLSLSISLCPN
jgi:hypothetical protein